MKNSEKIHQQTGAFLLVTDFFLVFETVFWPSYGSAKQGHLEKKEDGETAGVLILLAATVNFGELSQGNGLENESRAAVYDEPICRGPAKRRRNVRAPVAPP